MIDSRNRKSLAGLVFFMGLVGASPSGYFPATVRAQDSTGVLLEPENLRPIRLVAIGGAGFQFAGYYSAVEMDLYQEAGLAVRIDLDGAFINPVAEVVEGRAEFGLWNPELLVRRAGDQPIVVLAAIFQHSPMVVLTRRDSGLLTPQDLVGKSILYSPRQGSLEIQAMFLAEGVDPGDLDRVVPLARSGGWTDGLLAGDYDAVVAFLPLVEARYPDSAELFNVISPANYGIDFYGDCLFTSEALLERDPQLVKDFLEASLVGWQFAMAHHAAAAQIIQEKFCSECQVDSLLVEAAVLEKFIRSRQVEIGHMNRGRWQAIETVYRRLGGYDQVVDLDRFLYEPGGWESLSPRTRLRQALWLGLGLFLLIGFGVLTVAFCRWRLRSRLLGELRLQLEPQVGGKYRNEEQFGQAILRMGTALWDWNISPSHLNVSDQFIEITGYAREDVGAHPASHLALIHPTDRKAVREKFEAYLAGTRPDCNLEFRFQFHDGEYHWVKSRVVAFWDAEGKPARVVGSFTDISERVRAEEERDRLFNLSLDLLAVGGFEGFLQQVNPAWVRVLGWSRDDLMADPLLVFIHLEDQELFGNALKRLEEGDLVEDLQCRFRCRDNTYKWLSWSSFPYPEHRKVFSVVRDITSQKEAQFQLRESQKRLRSLNNQLSLVEDRQRRQLAEAIHDGLAQQLFGLRAMVTLLRYPEKLEDLQKVVTEIFTILDDTMTEARSLSFELFPSELQDLGLQAALDLMAHEFQERTGIRCTVAKQEVEGPELSEDLRAMAYQCVRELFLNVKKHAVAAEIKVTLNHMDRYLTVLVADNGQGFELGEEGDDRSRKLDHEGFGLFSIRERLRSVGGRMLVDSRPGQGCRVYLSFPLDHSAS